MRIDEGRWYREAAGEARPSPEHATVATHADRERQWLEREVARAASLSDADRVRIFRDLLRTVDAIHRAKSPEENRRAEEVRRLLDEPGRDRYRALAERLAKSE
jgi:hypothetical protein